MMQAIYPFIVLGVIGAVLGVVLSLANQYLTVKEDPRIDDIEKLLPNYNCGACGTPGCRAFSAGIVNGEVKNVSRCRPGKLDKHFNPILEYIKDHPNPDGTTIDLKL